MRIQMNFQGLLIVLNIVTIILKITGVIDWSWWWVMSPLLAVTGLYVLGCGLEWLGNKLDR